MDTTLQRRQSGGGGGGGGGESRSKGGGQEENGEEDASGDALSIPEEKQPDPTSAMARCKNSDGYNPLLYRIKMPEHFGYRGVFTILFASAAYRHVVCRKVAVLAFPLALCP
jgi:hypothetical protein